MISTLRFSEGYPVRLRTVGRRKFRFREGLNVLFGPNGSGKTTMLHSLAVATGCADGGWNTRRKDPVEPTPWKAEIDWDGAPVFYQDCYADSETSYIGDRLFENGELIYSTGEKRAALINELADQIEEMFGFRRPLPGQRPTLLLDEVDNHIGLLGQSILWGTLFPRMAKKCQIIASTHSLFPLLTRKKALIPLGERYKEICIEELARAIEVFNQD